MTTCFWLKTDYMISIKDLCVFPAAMAMQCNAASLLRRQLRPTKYREGSTPQHFRVKKRQGAFKTKYVLFFLYAYKCF